MKKILLMLFVIGVIFLTGCDHSPTHTGGSGLPDGWSIRFKTNVPLSYTWNVGSNVTFYVEIFDEYDTLVSPSEYDISSTTWIVEPAAGIVTLSDSTGSITHVEAIAAGTFKITGRFKGTSFYTTITVNP